jgi:lysophospholipase L1-like esterase
LNEAIATGEARARDVLAFRARRLRRRATAVRAAARQRPAAEAVVISPRTLASLGPPATAGVLVAEGDSWFDYPLHDVLEMLEDEHGFDVESVAHRGDRIEDMAFAPGQLEDFSRRLEKLLRTGRVPRAILLSGGGNDIAGEEFGMLLNHASSPIAGLNEDVVRGVVDVRIRTACVAIIAAITGICRRYLGRAVPIVTHGYACPVPDGRGFLGGFWILPGPWLEPGFREKGFGDRAVNTAIMQDLIGRFNAMLQSVAAQFAHVHYLDLRPVLPNDSRYRTYWANELHPSTRGYALVANEFATAISALP